MGFLRRRELAASAPLPASLTSPLTQIASPWASADALTIATWAGLLDAADNLPVTRQQAISLPAVARGRDLIATNIARMPMFARTASARLNPQPRCTAQPEAGRARFITLLWTVDSLIFYGFTAWQVAERFAEDGRPRLFRYVPPGYIETDSQGVIVSLFGKPVVSRDYVRFDGPHEGILQRANETVRTSRRLVKSYANAVDTPTPDVELHQTGGEPLTETEIDNLIARWVAKRQGTNGRVGYTNQSIQAILHGQQPEDLLIGARQAMNLDLARHMGLPAWAVDAEVGGSSLTYSNVPSRWRELIDGTLAGYMEAITSRLSLDDILAAGTWAEFFTDHLTEGSFGERMTAYKTARDAELYTVEELRRREAGQPMEGTA